MQAWAGDLATLTEGAGSNPWLREAGVLALLGSAAGGVAGAEQAVKHLKMGQTVRTAREKLSDRLTQAIEGVMASYQAVLDGIDALMGSRAASQRIHGPDMRRTIVTDNLPTSVNTQTRAGNRDANVGVTAAEVLARITRLEEAMIASSEYIDPFIAERSRQELRLVKERLNAGLGLTVAALAGGTGSGKSSL